MADGLGDIEGTVNGYRRALLTYDSATDGSSVQGHQKHEVVHTYWS